MKWPSEPRGPEPDDTPPADAYEVARAIALRHLDRRDLTAVEVRNKLAAKGVDDEIAEAVVLRFIEAGLLDDRRYALRYAEARQSSRSVSRAVVRRELQRKGVDPDLVDEAASGLDDESEYRTARDFAERRARSLGRHPREVQYRRLGGALARKGFPPSLVHRVLGEVLSTSDPDTSG